MTKCSSRTWLVVNAANVEPLAVGVERGAIDADGRQRGTGLLKETSSQSHSGWENRSKSLHCLNCSVRCGKGIGENAQSVK